MYINFYPVYLQIDWIKFNIHFVPRETLLEAYFWGVKISVHINSVQFIPLASLIFYLHDKLRSEKGDFLVF